MDTLPTRRDRSINLNWAGHSTCSIEASHFLEPYSNMFGGTRIAGELGALTDWALVLVCQTSGNANSNPQKKYECSQELQQSSGKIRWYHKQN
jgi:hypothetical protein